MKVEIASSKVVKPSIPTPNTLREYKLSFFDQLSFQIYAAYAFFYPKSHQNNAERCDHLEKSLSETLSCFYMLAGTWDAAKDHHLKMINCNDQGVEVTRALVHCDLNVETRPDTALVDQILPGQDRLMRANPRPVLAIQLNMFSCGGLGLGFRMLHPICDGHSRKMFFHHWSTTNRRLCRLGITNHSSSSPPHPIMPSFNLVSRFPGREVLVGVKQPNPSASVEKPVTKCFVYNSSFIAALKHEAVLGGGPTKHPPSKVVAVTAHVWRTFIRISETRNGYPRPCKLFFSMNLRGIIDVPPQSWGTLVSHPITTTLSGGGGDDDLRKLVDLLFGVITKDRNEFAQRSPDEIYSKLVDEFNEARGFKLLEEDLLPVTSFCGFGWYEAADFGWEKPSWISVCSLPIQMAVLMDSRDGDSVEVLLGLDEQDMVEFQRRFLDDQIQSKLLQPA